MCCVHENGACESRHKRMKITAETGRVGFFFFFIDFDTFVVLYYKYADVNLGLGTGERIHRFSMKKNFNFKTTDFFFLFLFVLINSMFSILYFVSADIGANTDSSSFCSPLPTGVPF